MMEQWAQFPEVGSGQIEVGRPARWDVDLVGRPHPFEVPAIAHAHYGMKWDRLPVRVVFDDRPEAQPDQLFGSPACGRQRVLPS